MAERGYSGTVPPSEMGQPPKIPPAASLPPLRRNDHEDGEACPLCGGAPWTACGCWFY